MTDSLVARFVDPNAGALLARCGRLRRALFLDRDGVINVDRNYVHSASETEWIPGIFELVASAHSATFLPVVVTNQAGIARGLYDEETFLGYTRWVHGVFSARGTPLLATFYCPHHPQAGKGRYLRECDCRKPGPGMVHAAAAAFAIDLQESILVGDKPSDIQAACAAGIGATHLVDPRAEGLASVLSRLVHNAP